MTKNRFYEATRIWFYDLLCITLSLWLKAMHWSVRSAVLFFGLSLKFVYFWRQFDVLVESALVFIRWLLRCYYLHLVIWCRRHLVIEIIFQFEWCRYSRQISDQIKRKNQSSWIIRLSTWMLLALGTKVPQKFGMK